MMSAPARLRPDDPLVSLVVPCFNEEEAIAPFLAEVAQVLAGVRLEIVFVNDGSRDGTLAEMIRHAGADPRIRVLDLSRNFGKEAALTAGIDHAAGDVVVPVDVDLQDPLAVIHDFLARWREGWDVVYGVRVDRGTDSVAKRATARWFYRCFNRLAANKIPENAGDFRLLDRRAVDTLKTLPERTRFMKGLFAWVGYRAVAVPYVRAVRSAGETKFNFWRLWNLALEGVFSFSSAPLRVWSYVGAGVALLALAFAVFIITKTLVLGVDVPGYASLMTIVLFLGGIQLFTLGIIGEYLGRVYAEVKGRPVYILDRVYQAPQPAPARARAEGESAAPVA